jgi:hypothetical protein
VLDGLWPAELSETTAQTATLAEYLNADLHRIVTTANQRLKAINQAQMADPVRRAETQRVLGLARAFAARRVESTVRQIRTGKPQLRAEARDAAGATMVLARVTEQPAVEPPPPTEPGIVEPDPAGPPSTSDPAVAEAPGEPDSGPQRLQRLLTFVARQQPELRWSVGDRADGTTLLVTDVAHGWIPPGIALPTGVRLLQPARRGGDLAALLGPTTLFATYAPGDRLGWATDFDATASSVQPRELPAVDDLGWLLGEATHWRDGLPRLAHTLARAGAAGTGVVDTETDLLRVHLDTARYQLLNQYPDLDAALLLNTLLLAATEGIAAGQTLSANYHFAWFQTLSAPPPSSWAPHR